MESGSKSGSILFSHSDGGIDQVTDATPWRLHATCPQFKVLRPIVMADPILVVHFFEPLEWSAQLGGHDLDMLGYVAVLARVRVIRFEDENIASVYVATESLTVAIQHSVSAAVSELTV
jgi:hypothetical protein